MKNEDAVKQNARMRGWFQYRTGLHSDALIVHMEEIDQLLASTRAAGWVSVSDQLPEVPEGQIDVKVLVSLTKKSCPYPELQVRLVTFIRQGAFFTFSDFRLDEISHWQPLPQPPDINRIKK